MDLGKNASHANGKTLTGIAQQGVSHADEMQLCGFVVFWGKSGVSDHCFLGGYD